MRYLVGIDEAGRGPLAGPVAVGAVIITEDFDWEMVKGVRDSKQLTEIAREKWYERMCALQEAGQLRFAVSFSSSDVIDEQGIVPAIRAALLQSLQKLEAAPDACEIRLDGSLKAPDAYKTQTTIIRGDQTEPIISLASVAAKVLRDRLMVQEALRYPAYGFEIHKGYGTAMHRHKIAEAGLCELHRSTFCTRLLNSSNKL